LGEEVDEDQGGQMKGFLYTITLLVTNLARAVVVVPTVVVVLVVVMMDTE